MSQKRNFRNLEGNGEVALLRLAVGLASRSSCLRKHTEAFVRVRLEKAIKAIVTDRNRSQHFGSVQQMMKKIE